MTQQPLPVATHALDPWTSRAAVEEHTASGQREKNIEVVYKAICQAPGATADDLSTITGIDVYEVRRRCSDLKNLHRIEQGEAVQRAGKRACVTWYPSAAGVALARESVMA